GGSIVCAGTPAEGSNHKISLTGKYLSGRLKVPISAKLREVNGSKLQIIGAKENNLKNIDVHIPLGKLVVITGVSGSGKSTLINDILYNAAAHKVMKLKTLAGKHKTIKGFENIDKIINIEQSPIRRPTRSNSATYTGLFTPLREMFAGLEEANLRGIGTARCI
ncbi:ATP-binding cassette domain-containing protein, partial [Leptospira interrogans serovar Pomona]|nr:ATP-binding cassette domain-containing protein [Leptospira interrogans serovar Pomona]